MKIMDHNIFEFNKIIIIWYNIKLDFKLIFFFKIDSFLEKNEIKDFFISLIFQKFPNFLNVRE